MTCLNKYNEINVLQIVCFRSIKRNVWILGMDGFAGVLVEETREVAMDRIYFLWNVNNRLKVASRIGKCLESIQDSNSQATVSSNSRRMELVLSSKMQIIGWKRQTAASNHHVKRITHYIRGVGNSIMEIEWHCTQIQLIKRQSQRLNYNYLGHNR